MKNLGTITDDKSILTKEYGDSTYAPTSLTDEVRDVSAALGTIEGGILSQIYVDANGDLIFNGKKVLLSSEEYTDPTNEVLTTWFSEDDNSEYANNPQDELDNTVDTWFSTGDSSDSANSKSDEVDSIINTWFN